ncbi:MAG: type IX secretion system outer membrane channel protein PorV [Dysgonamonadaceae bacterium]|jgi:hypothetical protein|nr:type IX secretion system outer membrane channel protein PorV [Dysgonamonadaceae bacterium]
MNRIKFYAASFLWIGFVSIAQAADGDDSKDYFNPLINGAPSLTIAPDTRGSSLGDVGAATEADVFSQYWNPAKYAFAYSKGGFGLSYTPWLKKIIDDIDLVYLAGYYKIGDSDRQAIGVSLHYFSTGKIDVSHPGEAAFYGVSPYDVSLDLSYSLKLSEKFAGAVAFRYFYSDPGQIGEGYNPASAFSADIAGYYHNYLMLGESECLLGLGFNISNMGSKISYNKGNSTAFLPANLKVGGSLLVPLDKQSNTLSFNLDANKYLFPAPPDMGAVSTEEKLQALHDYYAISSLSGIFKSFEEARISLSFGLEYAYDNRFFVRGGYFYEHPDNGNRQFFSTGVGFKLNAFQLDAAYLISTVPHNPLDQTLRLSLSFDIDGLKNWIK